jgi:hypothetical protein
MPTMAWPALGTVIAYSPDGASFVPLGQVTNIGNAGGGEVGERDTTTLTSIAHTNAPTIPDNGEVTFTVNLDPTDIGHQQVIAWKNTPPATIPSWRVTYASSPAFGAQFQAWVKSIEGANAEGVDDNLVADITLRVTGLSTIGAGI